MTEDEDSAPQSPTKEELYHQLNAKDEKLKEQIAKIKSLQQKVRRSSSKVDNLQKVLADLADKNLVRPNVAEALENAFSVLSSEVIMNHFNNKDKGNSHTVHVYEYVRPIFSLPHPRSIRHWTSSISCEPGFFEDVFIQLKKLVEQDPLNADCALLFDAMSMLIF